MNDNIPVVELPEFATLDRQLAHSVSFARECVGYRVGYDVELAMIVPVQRDGHTNMRIVFRRRPPDLRLVAAGA
jgi:hypothetical protein